MENQLYRASDDVISSKVGDETILLHTESDKAYGLDNTAAFVWALLDGQGKTRDQLLQSMTDHFDVDPDRAGQDLDALLAHLAREQLVYFHPAEPELRA